MVEPATSNSSSTAVTTEALHPALLCISLTTVVCDPYPSEPAPGSTKGATTHHRRQQSEPSSAPSRSFGGREQPPRTLSYRPSSWQGFKWHSSQRKKKGTQSTKKKGQKTKTIVYFVNNIRQYKMLSITWQVADRRDD